MGILKRCVFPLFLCLMVCAVSVYFYASEELATAVAGKADNRKTVIIDAGHGGLTNTIKGLTIGDVYCSCARLFCPSVLPSFSAGVSLAKSLRLHRTNKLNGNNKKAQHPPLLINL